MGWHGTTGHEVAGTDGGRSAGPRRLAVVGAGVSGLTAAYILGRSGARVTLYEADSRLGGHAHTHDVADAGGRALTVDTGFIVHNERTYPNLLRLYMAGGALAFDERRMGVDQILAVRPTVAGGSGMPPVRVGALSQPAG